MVRVWTVGIFWGVFSWIPYFIDLPLLFVFKVTIGLPVVWAVYLGVFMEKIFSMFTEQHTRLPDSFYFSLSLFTGIGLCWLIKALIYFRAGNRNRLSEKEVK